MFPFARTVPEHYPLPLFPLKTVLFPGGVLPLKVFEPRYIDMTKICLRDEQPFGVCLLLEGPEVLLGGHPQPQSFARIGTLARIVDWSMPQLGILHLRTEGAARFRIESESVASDGLVSGSVRAIAPEPALPLPAHFQPLAQLLEVLVDRVGREHFAASLDFADGSWVSYRLAELLPLPLTIKQSMLEVNDCGIRLQALAQFLKQQGVL